MPSLRVFLPSPSLLNTSQRDGNVVMSFNNKPATDSIPFLSPLLAPSARALGPLLEQLATSPLRYRMSQGGGWFVWEGVQGLGCH
jgi:hypothetical protein